MKTRYIKTANYYVPVQWQERDTKLWRLLVAWMAGLSGCFLMACAAFWMVLR